MDSDKPRRKHRFAPKAPSQRKTKAAAVSKTEQADSNDAEAQEQLLQRFTELGNRRRRSKAKDKAPMQPTFIHGGKRSVTDAPQDGGLKQSTESDSDDDSINQSLSSPSAAGQSVMKNSLEEGSGLKPKEYREPWNYADTYYPTTLPWRRPYSGNPAILDEAEFGEAAAKLKYDEGTVSSASELGFLNPAETSEDNRLLFLQFPPSLPAIKRSATATATAKGKEVEETSGPLGHKGPTAMNTDAKRSSTSGTSQRTCSLEEMPAGHMGKLLVYKSGAVKLRLGDTLFDVSPGSDCSFAQDAVAVNTEEKECCFIGNLDKRAVVTPDVENLLNDVVDHS